MMDVKQQKKESIRSSDAGSLYLDELSIRMNRASLIDGSPASSVVQMLQAQNHPAHSDMATGTADLSSTTADATGGRARW